MAGLFIGTSGWNYKHWKNLFYPEGLAQKKWLEFYSQQFDTAEVNYSFYRLPQQSTYEKWIQTVPPNFLFTLKCSRIITHNKRLNNLGDLWENFIGNATVLGDQLGPILCQLPENFQRNEQRLDEFLSYIEANTPDELRLRVAMEFRHESWFCKPVFDVLEKHNAACVIADSSQYPRYEVMTADFAYFRYHGPGRLFASNYSPAQLESEAKKMSKCLSQKMDVFGYFNNDGFGYAVKNAASLQHLLEKRSARRAG